MLLKAFTESEHSCLHGSPPAELAMLVFAYFGLQFTFKPPASIFGSAGAVVGVGLCLRMGKRAQRGTPPSAKARKLDSAPAWMGTMISAVRGPLPLAFLLLWKKNSPVKRNMN